MSDERSTMPTPDPRPTGTRQQQQSQPAQSIDELVDAWFNECIVRGPIAKNTDTYNAAQKARAELKRRLAGR
jgi:hypothetical protein